MMHDPILFLRDESALALQLRWLRAIEAILARPFVWRLGATLLIMAAALAFRLALSPVFGHPIFFFVVFYPAILAAALLFGFRAGLVTIAAVAILASLPFGSLPVAAFDKLADAVALAAFGVFGLGLVLVGGLLRNLSRARRDSDELLRLNAEQEQALRDNERRLKAMVDTAMEGIVSFDGSGAIVLANPAARDMFGYEKNEKLGGDVSMLMSDTLRLAHDGCSEDPRAGERKPFGARRRVEARRKDGAVFPLEIVLGETRLNGRRLFVGFLRDLSPIEEEKRRVNTLLTELYHAARLNDMGEVVASLAHEIGQPIAAIQNFAAACRRTMSERGEPPRPDLIALIEAQGRRASEILKRLRGFIAKRPPERRVEKIQDLIKDAIQLALLRSRAHVEHPLAANDADLSVFVDPVLIGQVLVNLLRNADDALADTPEPQIRVEAARAEPGMVRISVIDNGAGVDPKAVEDLFIPFCSSKTAGLGVGLSIGRKIVETYGGVLAYRPNAPRGSIFEFTLPIHAGDDEVSAPHS